MTAQEQRMSNESSWDNLPEGYCPDCDWDVTATLFPVIGMPRWTVTRLCNFHFSIIDKKTQAN